MRSRGIWDIPVESIEQIIMYFCVNNISYLSLYPDHVSCIMCDFMFIFRLNVSTPVTGS